MEKNNNVLPNIINVISAFASLSVFFYFTGLVYSSTAYYFIGIPSGLVEFQYDKMQILGFYLWLPFIFFTLAISEILYFFWKLKIFPVKDKINLPQLPKNFSKVIKEREKIIYGVFFVSLTANCVYAWYTDQYFAVPYLVAFFIELFTAVYIYEKIKKIFKGDINGPVELVRTLPYLLIVLLCVPVVTGFLLAKLSNNDFLDNVTITQDQQEYRAHYFASGHDMYFLKIDDGTVSIPKSDITKIKWD